MEHVLTTYIRTKTVSKHRLKDLKDYDTVKLYVYELKKLGVNNGPLLYRLRQNGEIWYDEKGNFKALRDGPIDMQLLEKTKKNQRKKYVLTDLHRWMRSHLLHVELDVPRDDMSVYFRTFLDLREKQLDAFFTVDAFSNRVHTPIVNLKENLRLSLRFYGEKIASLDVKQMQPTILARVLEDSMGSNSFSDAIWRGEDVYMLLLNQNKSIKTRAEAKKLLFQLIFGKPREELKKMFNEGKDWVEWINNYKRKEEVRNPHKRHMHTNLAWLLQYSEVQVMLDIWKALKNNDIPFLTIHDDVLCRVSDRDTAMIVMKRELKKHFKTFAINIDHQS